MRESTDISERMLKNQPFMMSLLIGYKFDVEEEALNDIMKIIFVIYLYFERLKKTNKKQLNSFEFEICQSKNLQFLNYFSGEENDKNKIKINKKYLSNLRSKSLFTGVLVMATTQNGFKRMNGELRGIVLIGMKTLIDCLELDV